LLRLSSSEFDPIRKWVGSKGRAQQARKVARIGVLGAASALRLGLRELGYVEGTNIVITYRSLTHGGCNSVAGSQLIVCLPRLNAATG